MNKKGLALIILTAVISGFSIFINKYGVAMSGPCVFAFLKNAAVALVFTGLILFLKDFSAWQRLTKKQWLWLMLIGIIGGGIPFLLFFSGLSQTGAAQSSLIHKTMFIYVALLAMVFLKEKLNKNILLGALLLLAGNLALLKGLKLTFGYGELLIFGATLFWAIESIMAKYLLRDLPPKIVIWGRMFFGSILILGYLAASGQAGQILSVSWPQAAWVGITGALLFGYVTTWYHGLKYFPVSLAAAILLSGSLITTALTAITSAKLEIAEAASAILILLGLAVVFGFHNIWRKMKALKINYVRT